MQIQDALAEFAHLLSVGSTALGNVVVENAEPDIRDRANQLLGKVDEIASRLSAIASEIERLTARK